MVIPRPSGATSPEDLYDPHKEEFKTPDGGNYVVYYAEETKEEHDNRERLEREKKENEEREKEEKELNDWRAGRKDEGKVSFNVSDKTETQQEAFRALKFPVFLGRDSVKNRWYIDYTKGYTEPSTISVEMIEYKHKQAYVVPIDKFLKEPTMTWRKISPPESFMNEIRKYAPLNFKQIEIEPTMTTMDPDAHEKDWQGKEKASMRQRADKSKKTGFIINIHGEPGHEHYVHGGTEPEKGEMIIVDANNPSKEDLKKIVEVTYGNQGIDEAIFNFSKGRYGLFEIREKED